LFYRAPLAGVMTERHRHRLIVRGLGPSVSGFGISNALQDPMLELRDGNGNLLKANNNWRHQGGHFT